MTWPAGNRYVLFSLGAKWWVLDTANADREVASGAEWRMRERCAELNALDRAYDKMVAAGDGERAA